MDLDELCRGIDARLDGSMTPRRAAHSRSVAELAAEICSRNGLDPRRGRAAGLAHDLCKELPLAEQARLASGYAAPRSSALMADKIVHGPAAAALLRSEYGLGDAELLDAIAWHTLGRPGMGVLEIAVYCADKLEPGRGHGGRIDRESILRLEPRAMLARTVAGVIDWLGRTGRPVAPETILLYNTLEVEVRAE